MGSFIKGASIIMFQKLIGSFLQSNFDLGSSSQSKIIRTGSTSFHQIFVVDKVIIVD
jgi:hypothetical protein